MKSLNKAGLDAPRGDQNARRIPSSDRDVTDGSLAEEAILAPVSE